MIEIFTDGACEGNQFDTNVGAWAFIYITDPLQKTHFSMAKAIPNTTNNQMELSACIHALEYANKTRPCRDITIYTDSEYVVKGMNTWRHAWSKRGWKNSKGEPVKNKDLWQQLIQQQEQCPAKFVHINGHAGNEWNEKVDQMAVAAIRIFKTKSRS